MAVKFDEVLFAKLGGHIESGSLYTLPGIRSRLGLGVAAIRTAKRRGLRVRRIGRRAFILGSDLIQWLERQER